VNVASVRVKFICRLGYGDSLPKDEDFSGDVPVFGSNGQYATTITRNTGVPVIVLGRKGSYGKVNWASDGCFASDTTFFVDERLTSTNLRWLYWSLQTLGLDEGSQEAAVPGLNRESVYEERICLPSLADQANIANYLDREIARIDGLVAEKEHMLALLEEKRIALISRAVTRGLDPKVQLKRSGQKWLGEIPAHWSLQRLKQLAEVRGGLTLGKRYTGVLIEYPYLRVANVQDGYLQLEDVLTVEVPASEAASNLLEYGDVLMNEGGDIDKLGRGCVWQNEIKPCLHQNHVFAVRPHSVDADWLALWTSTLEAKRYFESRAKRSTNLASISGSNIKELPVPLPPVDEQLAIKKFLAERQSRLESIRSELQDSLRLLTERRAALITAAVTGQIPLEEMAG
jgi:type I restriction enzyme, S subunit